MVTYSNLEKGSRDTDKGDTDYPNPFFDLSKNYLPKNIKKLFKHCRSFFYTNGLIRNIISKLTEYPITDVIMDGDLNQSQKDTMEKILYEDVGLKQLLIEIGLDYYTFGNSFISANVKFKRYLKCKNCGEETPIDDINFKFEDLKFRGKCPKCGFDNKDFGIEDSTIKNIESLNFVRWTPNNIIIDYDEIMGTTDYYYKISKKRKKKLQDGKKRIAKRTPKVFIEAIRDKKMVKLDKNNLYHFKKPTVSEQDQAWGKPPILPAMKDLYYMNTLKRGNEAIANEHIVPKKSVFPSPNGPIDPYTSMSLSKWKGNVEEQIREWKKDPNHIAVFPIPIGYQEMGGNANRMKQTNELDFLENSAIMNMGLPLDFIKGGASWTGSSVSLRIVENLFIPYREMLTKFMNNFLAEKLNNLLNLPRVKLRFKELKMSDDSESKQIAMNLREMQQISQRTLLEKFGVDYDQEKSRLKEEQKDTLEQAIQKSIEQARAKGKSQELLARYNTRAQKAMQDEAHRMRENKFEEEVLKENKNFNVDASELIDALATRLSLYGPMQQQQVYQQLAANYPVTAAFVMERLIANGEAMFGQQAEGEDMMESDKSKDKNGRPRESNTKEDQVKRTGSKQKGNTRGQPNV